MDPIILALPMDHTYNLPLVPVWVAILFALVALFLFALALMIAHAFVTGGPGTEIGFLVCMGISLFLGVFSYVSFHEHLASPPSPEVVVTQEAS